MIAAASMPIYTQMRIFANLLSLNFILAIITRTQDAMYEPPISVDIIAVTGSTALLDEDNSPIFSRIEDSVPVKTLGRKCSPREMKHRIFAIFLLLDFCSCDIISISESGAA